MIEKILEQIDENTLTKESVYFLNAHGIKLVSASKMKEIVQEVAKDGGWIPANVTPKPVGRYLCDVIFLWEGRVESKVVIAKYDNYWRIADGYEILAWQPLPAPYQKGE